MDEKQVRKINRQLRGIKFMLGFFSLLLIATLLIMGFVAWKVVAFTHNAESKITNIQTKTEQSLDLKQQLCDSGSVSAYLQQNSSLCN